MIANRSISPRIREALLRDSKYPIHKIADRLLPYLNLLTKQFCPKQVILFGSYAYGNPTKDSDIDLLIITNHEFESSLKERIRIRRAWWNMARTEPLLPFDLLVVSPEKHRERLANSAGFYNTIVHNGLKLI